MRDVRATGVFDPPGAQPEALKQVYSFNSSLQIRFKGKKCSISEDAAAASHINVSVYAVYPDGVSKPTSGQGKPSCVEKLPLAVVELQSSGCCFVPAVLTACRFYGVRDKGQKPGMGQTET